LGPGSTGNFSNCRYKQPSLVIGLDNMSNLADINRENLQDIQEGLGDTCNQELSEA